MEKQDGMSFALRFLFDRNNSHFLVRISGVLCPSYQPFIMILRARRRSSTRDITLPRRHRSSWAQR